MAYRDSCAGERRSGTNSFFWRLKMTGHYAFFVMSIRHLSFRHPIPRECLKGESTVDITKKRVPAARPSPLAAAGKALPPGDTTLVAGAATDAAAPSASACAPAVSPAAAPAAGQILLPGVTPLAAGAAAAHPVEAYRQTTNMLPLSPSGRTA